MSMFTGKFDLADSIRDKSLHGLLDFARKTDIFEYTSAHVGKDNVEWYAKQLPSLPTFIREIRVEWTKRGYVRKAFAVMSKDNEFAIDLTGRSKENSVRVIRKVDGMAPGEVARRLRRIVGMSSWGNGDGRNGFVLLTSRDYTDTMDERRLSHGVVREGRPFEELYYQRYLWSILPWTMAYEQAPSSIFRFYTKIETTGTYVLTFENRKRRYRNFDIQVLVDFESSSDMDEMEEGLIEMSGRSLEEVSAFLGEMGDDGHIIFEPDKAKEILRNGIHTEDNGGRKE